MPRRVVVREARVRESPADIALLDDGERARAERKGHQDAFITGHALVRRVLGELLERDPAELSFARRCTTCGSDRHGKPSPVDAPGWRFSLSYTGELAVVAVADGVDVGVDTEELTDVGFDGFVPATLADEEVAAFADLAGDDLFVARARVWARKEAILKATGHGLVVDPAEVLVTGPQDPPALVDWRAEEPWPPAVSLVDLDLTARDHRAAVAALVDGALDIELG